MSILKESTLASKIIQIVYENFKLFLLSACMIKIMSIQTFLCHAILFEKYYVFTKIFFKCVCRCELRELIN